MLTMVVWIVSNFTLTTTALSHFSLLEEGDDVLGVNEESGVTYLSSFYGSHLVDWLVTTGRSASREHAVKECRKYLENDIIRHGKWGWNIVWFYFNSLAPERCGCDLKLVIFKFISRIDIGSISCDIALRCKYHKTTFMISQHWFKQWLGAIKQEAKVDQDL